jgi:hypothetical protein
MQVSTLFLSFNPLLILKTSIDKNFVALLLLQSTVIKESILAVVMVVARTIVVFVTVSLSKVFGLVTIVKNVIVDGPAKSARSSAKVAPAIVAVVTAIAMKVSLVMVAVVATSQMVSGMVLTVLFAKQVISATSATNLVPALNSVALVGGAANVVLAKPVMVFASAILVTKPPSVVTIAIIALTDPTASPNAMVTA